MSKALFTGTMERLHELDEQVVALAIRLDELLVLARMQPKQTNPYCDKRTYRSERDARMVMNTNRKKGIRTAYRLRTYRCETCGGWHLTKQEQ